MGGITRVIFTSCQSLQVGRGCASERETSRANRRGSYTCSEYVLQALLIYRDILLERVDRVDEIAKNIFWRNPR
jgi:hypothetical protein